VQKLRRPPSPDFRLVVLLPARANQGREDTRGKLQLLIDADSGGGRFTASTLSAMQNQQVERIYVHAKVAIVDDRWLTIGSANLNERGLFNDSEAKLVTRDPHVARNTRLRLRAEHLDRPVEQLGDDPTQLIDHVGRPTAREQRERAARGQPRTHRLMELPALTAVRSSSGRCRASSSTVETASATSRGPRCAICPPATAPLI
jgi:phosphatidylserine/phosphatidylglycerophosphate/cardiolipin synthase-like enzyme